MQRGLPAVRPYSFVLLLDLCAILSGGKLPRKQAEVDRVTRWEERLAAEAASLQRREEAHKVRGGFREWRNYLVAGMVSEFGNVFSNLV